MKTHKTLVFKYLIIMSFLLILLMIAMLFTLSTALAESNSICIYKNSVKVQVTDYDAYIVAVDCRDREIRWKLQNQNEISL